MRLRIVAVSLLLFVGVGAVLLTSIPDVSAADISISPGDITRRGGVDPGKQSNNIVVNVLNGVYQIAAMVSVMIIVLSGIRYIIADGDPAKINAARKGIIYSLVGLVIIGSAFIITGIIQNLV